ncbi:SDR family NAD(P)-dependent oxidoreductase [Nocardioides sp. NPDC101246]|uniref:SDR family NAD(P)-dependent oxidoreductase n=1 Tax=Nocardioides sp. NPDC101246 TaxID=3364336 RepID=UPI00382377E2
MTAATEELRAPSTDLTDLTGQVAVVTGASSGLGRRFAEVLAARGATVVAAARRLDLLEKLAADQDRVVPFRCDVTDEADRAALVARAEELGGVDVLVNNAGWAEALPAAEQPLDSFRRTLEIDLTALFALSVEAYASMRARGGGSIVNIASVLGMVGSAPVTQSAYGAAKGGVVTLTRHLACEWARDGVRVNAIAPGFFPSELTADMFADTSAQQWLRRNTPMGRTGRGDELDGVLLLLAGPGSSYLTGQVLAVDGGWTAR